MSNYELLVNYLEKNLNRICYSSGTGLGFDFPDFELMPFDYLEFCEQDLSINSTSSKISCVSNLKRATECEMDTLLHILGVANKVKSFPRKLDFISKAGLISPRSLEKLNKIRNKMEHEYSVPELGELESYFDLASGFVHSIEGYIFMLYSNAEQEWTVGDPFGRVAFNLNLERDPARITFEIHSEEGKKTLEFNTENLDEYAKALKAFFLLCRAHKLLSSDYVISKLTETPLNILSGRG